MKSMKRLVLAGLVLLASVVVLAGCKNDSVPEVPKYTVTFDKNAEDATGEMTPQTFTQGEKKELTANAFERPTWTFSGWSTNKEAATPEYGNQAQFSATKDTTLYAIWTDNGTVTPVTFTSQDGTKFFYGETVTLSTTTEYATIKYRLDDSEDWKTYNEAISITSDTNITAYATKAGLKDSAETTASYTVRTLKGITVTPPTRTVYSVGESFDGSDMVVTATYDDERYRKVTGWTTNFDEVTREKGLKKEVIVSYTEGDNKVTAIFTVDVASYQFTETVQDADSNYAGTMSGGTYKKFGDWPQTIKAADVIVGSGTLVRGGLTYHVGNDGNYYVKAAEKANGTGEEYKYSDRTQALRGGTSTQWFKVEPIVWRVLTESYNSTGKALLLAENILTGGIPYYVDGNERTITGAGTDLDASNTVYPNNYKYSTIRAWLNGKYEDDDTQDKSYTNTGFLQTAFTENAQEKIIVDTKVDNSARSTNPDSNATQWNSGKNEYACENTTDKIFLLSEQEATKSDYVFAVYNAYGQDNTRIRVTTDYAKATGAYQSGTAGYGGWWWLRSPIYNYELNAHYIYDDGNASISRYVYDMRVGVVPALSISLEGN